MVESSCAIVPRLESLIVRRGGFRDRKTRKNMKETLYFNELRYCVITVEVNGFLYFG